MQWLASLCVRRPVFAWVLVLSLTVVGLFAFGRLGVDRFPNVDIPTISVTTRLPGAAPEQIETEVTDKIEESVNTISGIDTLTSTSSEGISQVVVSFKLEKDADTATKKIYYALQLLTLDPAGATAHHDALINLLDDRAEATELQPVLRSLAIISELARKGDYLGALELTRHLIQFDDALVREFPAG